MTDKRGIIGAVVAFAAVVMVPVGDLSMAGQYALAIMVFAGLLWVTGDLPLPITALTIPVLLVSFGVVPTTQAAMSGFADPIIFLLLAGFVLAETLQKHGIDRRIAYWILATIGSSPKRVVFAVMVATAGLSMIISNSATAAMMIPIALGIAESMTSESTGSAPQSTPQADTTANSRGSIDIDPDPSNLELAMLLGVAYAASVGGVGTLIGTPPNAIVVSQLAEQLDYTITFVDWLVIGLPFVVIGLPITWYILVGIVYPPERGDASAARSAARTYLDEAGSLTGIERRVVLITGLTAVFWILGGLGFVFEGVLPPTVYRTLFGGSGEHLFGSGSHQGILYFVVVGLVAIPALSLSGAIEWSDVHRIDWGTIVLLGGGISLADALAATDATRWIAETVIDSIVTAPIIAVALILAGITVAVSEIASNTAMAAISAPILISIGPEYAAVIGGSPTQASVFLAVTGGVAASFGFALPVATPPNAIAFGTGEMTKDQMLRPGLLLDIAMILVTGVVTYGLFVVLWPTIG